MAHLTTPRAREPLLTGRVTRFFRELRRRKVLRTAGVYLAMAFITLQIFDVVAEPLLLPEYAGRLVIVLLTFGFPISMALAWVLELTREGVRLELSWKEAEAAAALQDGMPGTKELRPDSVAVLPFENLSDDPEDEYFSDGITGDIIASISSIRGLRVLCRTSVMQYKGVSRHIAEIAGELGVATVVAGNVRRSGSRVRIVAELVDARNDAHLWSEVYERDLEDIFRIQSEVAASVAEAVRRELSPVQKKRIEARGTTNSTAYDQYLRARFLWNQRDGESVAKSVGFFRRALENDPGFALAHSGLADAHTVLGIYGVRAPTEAFPSARAAADRALAIDPTLGEALTSRACLTAVFDWDWQAAERAFELAIESAPSYATAHQWYAVNALAPQARFEKAHTELDRARALDPGSSAIAVSRGILRFYAGDLERATEEFLAIVKLHPGFGLAHYFLGQCHQALGHPERALGSLERAIELSYESSETLAAYGHALAQAGDRSEAEATLGRLEARARERYVSPALLAQVLIGLDREADALDQLERAAERRAADLIWIGLRPIYDRLRGSPRFEEILSLVGLAPVSA